MKKGIFYAMDAIIAIALLAVAAMFVYTAMQGIISPPLQESDLAIQGYDSLAVLEKDHSLSNAGVSGNISRLQLFLDIMPPNVCGNLSLFDSNFTIMSSVQKSGCVLSADIPVALTRRTFMMEDSFGVADFRTWNQ